MGGSISRKQHTSRLALLDATDGLESEAWRGSVLLSGKGQTVAWLDPTARVIGAADGLTLFNLTYGGRMANRGMFRRYMSQHPDAFEVRIFVFLAGAGAKPTSADADRLRDTLILLPEDVPLLLLLDTAGSGDALSTADVEGALGVAEAAGRSRVRETLRVSFAKPEEGLERVRERVIELTTPAPAPKPAAGRGWAWLWGSRPAPVAAPVEAAADAAAADGPTDVATAAAADGGAAPEAVAVAVAEG